MTTTTVSDHELGRLLVVIVNYRTSRLVEACLRSLESEILSLQNAQVVVVDNDSGDDSQEYLSRLIAEQKWQAWAALLCAPSNEGYASGNNLAIRASFRAEHPPDFVWMLNPDSQVKPNAARALLSFAQSHPQAGIMGSGLSDENGPWPVAFRFTNALGELEAGLRLGLVTRMLRRWTTRRRMPDAATAVDWLPGASLMVRRQVFETVGLLDEGYFLYFEETDFCLRAKQKGWECWYVPDSHVLHYRGQSTGVTAVGAQERLPSYWFDSRRRYFIKHHGLLRAAVTDLAWVVGLSLWRLRRRIQRKPDTDHRAILHDAWTQGVLFKGLRTHRELHRENP